MPPPPRSLPGPACLRNFTSLSCLSPPCLLTAPPKAGIRQQLVTLCSRKVNTRVKFARGLLCDDVGTESMCGMKPEALTLSGPLRQLLDHQSKRPRLGTKWVW